MGFWCVLSNVACTRSNVEGTLEFFYVTRFHNNWISALFVQYYWYNIFYYLYTYGKIFFMH
jgi:hypothetical protein